MKQTLFLLAFALLTFTLSAQDFSNLKDVEIKTAEECRTYLQQAELKVKSLSGEDITPL